jgi:hypothetical protein
VCGLQGMAGEAAGPAVGGGAASHCRRQQVVGGVGGGEHKSAGLARERRRWRIRQLGGRRGREEAGEHAEQQFRRGPTGGLEDNLVTVGSGSSG